jgi:hypothetical protein
MTLLAAAALGGASAGARAELAVLGVQYRADQSFPEHECFWYEGQFPGPCGPSSRGGSIHVLLRNNGSSPVTVQDVTFGGYSLAELLVLHYQVAKRQPASIWLAGLSPAQLQQLLGLGEPVWYKTDPATVAPGACTHVAVRLRQTPQASEINLGIVHTAGTTAAVVPVAAAQPRPVGVSFSADLDRAYVYWQRAEGGAPAAVLVDGVDVTARTTTVAEAGVSLAASVIQLAPPLSPGSLHAVQGVYADGKVAIAAARAWNNPFIYGTWGAQSADDGDYAAARAWIDDATNHSVNALVVQLGSSGLGDLLKTASGREYAADHGYGFVIDDIAKWSCENPLLWFIRDEPDAADSRVTDLPSDKMVGSLAQMSVQQGEALRAAYPAAPTVLNLDMTYKPYNWYNYGQVADVMMSDPYYQVRLREAYWGASQRIPLYSKATYVYAVSQLAQSSAEPNPLHIILYSCEYVDTSLGQTFPYPTPESKRIEVYYALAGGAKGLSYWWYLPGKPSNGLGARTSSALALWREIGLLGAEIGTAAPLLTTACPATVPVQPSTGLWVRSLLAGADTLLLLAVNDQYTNDPKGCHYSPLTNASVSVTLPAWLQSPTVFEISTAGTRSLPSQLAGRQLQVSLGTVNLTRMIVVTGNNQVQSTIQKRFDQTYRSRVCTIAPDICPVVVTIPGDFDDDGDVDQEDFGHMQSCLTGPTVPQTDPACRTADLNHDDNGDVSQLDLTLFLRCFTGPGIQGDPMCAN